MDHVCLHSTLAIFICNRSHYRLERVTKMWESLWKLMTKKFCLAHFQMTNTLTLQLIWFSTRSLSYYTPRKPEASSLLVTNTANSRCVREKTENSGQNILFFLACIFTKRSTSRVFCSLTGCPFFIHIWLVYRRRYANAAIIVTSLISFLFCPFGIICIIIDFSDHESNEEVPLAIPLCPIADGISCRTCT